MGLRSPCRKACGFKSRPGHLPFCLELFTLLNTNPIIPLPLLITGVSGVAGWNALPFFLRLWPGRVIGIRPNATRQLVADGVVALDTEDRAGLHALFEKHRFGAVLNCTGNCASQIVRIRPGDVAAD